MNPGKLTRRFILYPLLFVGGMLAAVNKGVEIADDGNVFGLLWVDRICGNDPCMWDRRRGNPLECAPPDDVPNDV